MIARVLVLAAIALGGCGLAAAPPPPQAKPEPPEAVLAPPAIGEGTALTPLAVRLEDRGDPVRVRFKHPPRAGLLFDVDTGRVLWRHRPWRVRLVASLS